MASSITSSFVTVPGTGIYVITFCSNGSIQFHRACEYDIDMGLNIRCTRTVAHCFAPDKILGRV